jgi:hypothetical protein
MKRRAVLLCLIVASLWPGAASADRVFYRSGVWLETSAGVRRLSLLGVLRAWEQLAETAAPGSLSLRQREAMRLHDCLIRTARSHDEMLERVTSLSRAYPDRIHYSLSDFIADGVKDLCPR